MSNNVDINSIKSNVCMENFYFSECSVTREPEIKDGNLNMELNHESEKLEEHKYRITLSFIAFKDSNDLNVKVVAKAIFSYNSDNYDNEDDIIKKNTVAIMFPFIRSQVSLMTSQPNMKPVVIPAINATKL